MGLNFLFICIICASFLLTKNDAIKEIQVEDNEDLPKIFFLNSTLYELNQREVDKIVKAKETFIYEKKEELNDAILVLRGSSSKTNTISGKHMKKDGDIFSFKGGVVFQKGDDLELKTQSLTYNDTTGIVSNNVDFVFNYKNSLFSGNTLYINKNDYAISGQKAHFVLNEKDL